MSSELMYNYSYTFFVNFLSWPSGVVPVTRVQADEQSYPVTPEAPRGRGGRGSPSTAYIRFTRARKIARPSTFRRHCQTFSMV